MFQAIRHQMSNAVYHSLLSGPWRGGQPVKKRICIYKPDAFGDFILALSAVRLLVEEFGEDETVIVTGLPGAELAMAEFPRVARVVHPFHPLVPQLNQVRRLWHYYQGRRKIGAYRFERLVCLRHQRSGHGNLQVGWVNANRRFAVTGPAVIPHLGESVEFAPDWSDAVMYLPAPRDAEGGQCEELKLHQILVSAVLGRRVSLEDVLPRLTSVISTEGSHAVISALSGGVTSQLRNLPFNLLKAGLGQMARRGVDRVFLCGSAVQRGALEALAIQVKGVGPPVEVLTPTGFAEFARVVAAARVVFTAETGPAHLATALDKPTVVLIGGGHYGQFGPWKRSGRQVWLTNHVPCFHCNWVCSQPEPICVTRIEPTAVEAALDQVLSETAGGHSASS